MTEIFTTQPQPGPSPAPNGKGPSDTKLNWLIGGAAVFLVVALGVLGWVLLKGGDDGAGVATAQDNESAQDSDPETARQNGGDGDDADADGSDEADGDGSPSRGDTNEQVTLPAAASTTPSRESSSGSAAPRGTALVRPANVSVSNTRDAVPSLTCTKQPLSYIGEHLIDGDPQTGWGASRSDGAGQSAQFNFGESKQISTVGITPGYLRVAERNAAGCAVVSAFPYNRFIDSVRWEFEDGSAVVQDFDPGGEMQTIEVDQQTSFVRMEILSTTRPAGADNDTVISDAQFTGTP